MRTSLAIRIDNIAAQAAARGMPDEDVSVLRDWVHQVITEYERYEQEAAFDEFAPPYDQNAIHLRAAYATVTLLEKGLIECWIDDRAELRFRQLPELSELETLTVGHA